MTKFYTFKRLSALLFVTVILTALLAACGDPTATTAPATTAAPTTTAATTTAAPTTTAATTTAAPATTAAATGSGITINVAGTDVTLKPGGGKIFNPTTPTTITIWSSQRGANHQALLKLADDFKATHSNITLKFDNNNETFSYGDILKKLQAAATAGGLPNLATGYENWVPGFVDSKTILGFNQYISGEYGLTQEVLNDIQPAFLARGIFPQYGNETYLFPFGNSTPVLYYNKDLLEKYNIAVPQTWDDLVKASQNVSKQTSNATAGLVFNPKTVSELVAGMYSQGCKVYDYASKTWFFTDPTCVRHLQIYYDGVKNGYFTASDPTKQNDDQAIFEQQKALFYISSTSSRSFIDSDLAKGLNGAKVFNWNATVLPRATEVKTSVSTLYGGGVLAFKGKTADEDLSTWEVAKFLASTAFTAKWAASSGYAPVTKSALNDQTFKDFLGKNPHNGIPVETIKFATASEPKLGYWQNIRDEFDNSVFALFQDQSGAVTVESTLKKIQGVAAGLSK